MPWLDKLWLNHIDNSINEMAEATFQASFSFSCPNSLDIVISRKQKAPTTVSAHPQFTGIQSVNFNDSSHKRL